MSEEALAPVERIDPQRLLAVLSNDGWTTAGGRSGLYVRLRPPSIDRDLVSERWSLLVPLDMSAPDYPDLMRAAILELTESPLPSLKSRSLLPRLQMGQTDSFIFRKESAAPSGLISWRDGEELVHSARQTLVAGAKTHLSQLRRFSNRFGQFAGRYLDTVFMGQTAVGSYVVTAYAPVDSPVALSSTKAGVQSLPGLESASTREISLAVGRALDATQEAVAHFRSSGNLTGFDDAVARGVSFDLLTALQGVTRNSDSGEVVLEWVPDPQQEETQQSKFEFTGADTAVLEKASVRLAADTESNSELVIVGRVHLLTKKDAGAPGVFGMETIGSNSKKYRVRLSDAEEYHIAVRAHDEDLAIRVNGVSQKDGTLAWLYNASVQAVVGSVDELRTADPRSGRSDTDQLALGDM